MRVTVSRMLWSAAHGALLFGGSLLLGCGPSQPPASPPAPDPKPAASVAPPAAPSEPPSAAPAVSSAPAQAIAPAEPPPLTGSVGRVASSDMPETCNPDMVRKRLTQVTDNCRGDMKEVCGKLLVQAKHGDEDVAVSFDVGSGAGTSSFVSCVTKAMQTVRWECAEPGKDITLDLGSCL